MMFISFNFLSIEKKEPDLSEKGPTNSERKFASVKNLFLYYFIGCTLKEGHPLRVVKLVTRTTLYSVSKET